jgi:cephalosporin-C deacetylase
VLAAMGFIDTTSPPAGVWTELNEISVPTEPLPMIESEHNNLTPQEEQNRDARSKEVLAMGWRVHAERTEVTPVLTSPP